MQSDDRILVACTCGRRYMMEASRAGKRVACRACGAEMVIPQPLPTEELVEVGDQGLDEERVSASDPGDADLPGDEDELSGLASAIDVPGTYAEHAERRRMRPPRKSWLDEQFADTNMVLIIIVAVFGCCSCFVLPFSLIGLIACRHPVAKRNAAILFFSHLFWLAVFFLYGFLQAMQEQQF